MVKSAVHGRQGADFGRQGEEAARHLQSSLSGRRDNRGVIVVQRSVEVLLSRNRPHNVIINTSAFARLCHGENHHTSYYKKFSLCRIERDHLRLTTSFKIFLLIH